MKDLNLDYNEKENMIFLNESLTNQNAILFKKVRQACRDKHFKFFWTVNRKIMCRKTQQSPVVVNQMIYGYILYYCVYDFVVSDFDFF